MADMAQSQDPFTSLGARESTVERLEGLKPYTSMSWDEFLREMADTYEERHNDDPGRPGSEP